MKNLEKVAAQSRWGTEIYYSVKEQAVYTRPGKNRWHVTTLLRENSPEEIEKAIKRWLWM